MMRIILFDLENTPLQSFNWGIYDQTAIKVTKEWELLSFSYKELGKQKIYVLDREGEKTDKQLAWKLWLLFNSADVLIAHNGDRFDIRKAHARFIHWGFSVPMKPLSLDTLKIARRHFAFTSNKLNDLGKYLGIGQKLHTGGFKLWEDCMANKASAWHTMRRYNKQDVVLLEKVYKKLSKWDDLGNRKLAKLRKQLENK
jgi:DNA polymerase III epsilon subunit-like protein